MTRSISAALLLGLLAVSFSPCAIAGDAGTATQASQIGEAKQFGTIKVTLDQFSIQGAKADVVLQMDNLSDEDKEIAMLLFIDAKSESGELGDYDYARSHCDGALPAKGRFTCKLALIFPAPPKQISIRVGEGMAAETVTFNLAP